MKKTIIAAITLLINFNLFACHLPPLGWCGGQAYFSTAQFENDAVFEFRYYGADTVALTYTTKHTGSTDTTLTFEQPIQNYPVRIQFRWKKNGGNWNAWGNNGATPNYFQGSTNQLPGCSVLAVSFSDVSAINNDGELTVQFTNEDESNVSHYNIMLSKDGVNWDKVKEVPATGNHSYSVGIGLTGLAFIFPFLVGFKKKKYLPFAIIVSIILFSCQKESIVSTTNDYKYAKVQSVSMDGSTVNTNVLPFKR